MPFLPGILKAAAKPFKWFWFKAKLPLKLAIVAAIVLLLVALAVGSYIVYLKYQIAVVKEGQSQAGQIAVDNAKANANVAGNVANQSVNEANQARKANINSFNTDFNDARRKYCEDEDLKDDCK